MSRVLAASTWWATRAASRLTQATDFPALFHLGELAEAALLQSLDQDWGAPPQVMKGVDQYSTVLSAFALGKFEFQRNYHLTMNFIGGQRASSTLQRLQDVMAKVASLRTVRIQLADLGLDIVPIQACIEREAYDLYGHKQLFIVGAAQVNRFSVHRLILQVALNANQFSFEALCVVHQALDHLHVGVHLRKHDDLACVGWQVKGTRFSRSHGEFTHGTHQ